MSIYAQNVQKEHKPPDKPQTPERVEDLPTPPISPYEGSHSWSQMCTFSSKAVRINPSREARIAHILPIPGGKNSPILPKTEV